MRHAGQGFDIPVPLPPGTLDDNSRDVIGESFYATYHKLFERVVKDVPIELMSWRVSAMAPAYEVSMKFSGDDIETKDPAGRGPNCLFRRLWHPNLHGL